MAKNGCPVGLLSFVSKIFEKLVINRPACLLKKCDLFSDFHYGFRSSYCTADLLAVVGGLTIRVFKMAGVPEL